MSGVVGALGGSLWGPVESVTDVLIGGVSRYAPVVAPPLLVAPATLAAQTIVSGSPLTWAVLPDFTLWKRCRQRKRVSAPPFALTRSPFSRPGQAVC